ncbi:hypothetical protein J0X19_07105 [Hymenobacter sp. BT186]|uniref:Uncharacterized protein n=1 Tax=Hymenobacter telluris TaxID=2816474 RepID=A0A939EUJ8_9BACT|nr:hypothetical protein [Hymenobacter telluris]MBO0357708.1 hypothetical protein [Hymenobacter telluris]MBW3373735.1 hypothetical protein [Hymenobacter norwichensis]
MRLPSKQVFYTTISIATLTLLAVWFVGLQQQWSIFKDSLISLTILSTAFLTFITVGLYEGVRLHDDVGNLLDYIRRVPFPESFADVSLELPKADLDDGEGCGGIIIAVFLWLLAAVAAIFLLWCFAAVAWVVLLVFAGMLYWVFFRALRLVFRHSRMCKGRFSMSLRYGLAYTLLYNFWIYGIILAVHYLR